MRNPTYATKVLRVIDGDSLVVATQHHTLEIRLYGIDAPEHSQPGADESRTALRRKLGNQVFWLEEMDVDHYGRVIGLLYHRDQHRDNSINRWMIHEGHAYAFTRYGGGELGFDLAEADARDGRRGIWRESRRGGERPWNYRRSNRRSKEAVTASNVVIFLIVLIALIALAARFCS